MAACLKGRSGRHRPASVALVLITTASGAALVSCDTGNGDTGSSSSFSPPPAPPDTSSFSGTPPSPLASADASGRASASAAASSASAAASAFEASVSAEVARANAAAAAELKKVQGGGNARSDVSLTGKPRADTGGLLAAVVNISNRSDRQASFAVQVDFADSSGKVRETRIVGAEDLDPGERTQALAISRKPAELGLTPRIARPSGTDRQGPAVLTDGAAACETACSAAYGAAPRTVRTRSYARTHDQERAT